MTLGVVSATGARTPEVKPKPKPHKHKPAPHVTPPAPAVPPVVAENAKPGTPGWLGPAATGRAAEVYAGATDALPGDSVSLHVSVADGAAYRVLVYRLGWYAGVGARQVACLPSCDGSEQGVLQPMPTGETDDAVEANWPTTDTLAVGSDWVSGYYLIRVLLLGGSQAGNSATTYLIVESTGNAKMLSRCRSTPGRPTTAGADAASTIFPGLRPRANHVSFDRPTVGRPGRPGAARLGDSVRPLRRAQRLRRQLPVRRLHRREPHVAPPAPARRRRGAFRVLDEDHARRVRCGA